MSYLGQNSPVRNKPLRFRGVYSFDDLGEEIRGRYRFHHGKRYDSTFSGRLISETPEEKVYNVAWQTGRNSGHGTITVRKDGTLIFDQTVAGSGIYRYKLS